MAEQTRQVSSRYTTGTKVSETPYIASTSGNTYTTKVISDHHHHTDQHQQYNTRVESTEGNYYRRVENPLPESHTHVRSSGVQEVRYSHVRQPETSSYTKVSVKSPEHHHHQQYTTASHNYETRNSGVSPSGTRVVKHDYAPGATEVVTRTYVDGQLRSSQVQKSSRDPSLHNSRVIKTTTYSTAQNGTTEQEHVKKAHQYQPQQQYGSHLNTYNNYSNQTSTNTYNTYTHQQKAPYSSNTPTNYNTYTSNTNTYKQGNTYTPSSHKNYYGTPSTTTQNTFTNQVAAINPTPSYQQTYVPKVTKKQVVNQHMQLREVVNKLQATGQMFNDSEFKPTAENIGGDFTATWKRINKIIRNPKIFVDQVGGGSQQIEPNDIQQGELGDCYFLSTLAALAEFEQNIRNLFSCELQSDKVGIYCGKVCWIGVWKEVLIDNYFPFSGDKPCFSHCKEDELWVLILEKIWAKLHGSYCQIDGGLTKEPLHDLTGAPAKTFFTTTNMNDPKYNDVWNRIKQGEIKDYVMTAGSIDEDAPGGSTMEQNHGIAPGHAYSLLAAKEVNIQGRSVRLVQLRNPWSNVEWKGKYGDNDPLWNHVPKDLKDMINFPGRNDQDGIFFMEYNEFVKYFENLQICYHRPSGVYNGVSFQGSHSGTCFKITVPTTGAYYFQVSQKSIRAASFDVQDNVPTNRFYNQTSLIVAPQSNTQNCLVAVKGNQRDLTSFKYIDGDKSIASGVYYAYVEVEKGNYNSLESGFGVYGPSECQIEEVSAESLGNFAHQSKQTCQHPQIERY